MGDLTRSGMPVRKLWIQCLGKYCRQNSKNVKYGIHEKEIHVSIFGNFKTRFLKLLIAQF